MNRSVGGINDKLKLTKLKDILRRKELSRLKLNEHMISFEE